jgi:8-oxo-dGTP diphosphatase
MVRVGLIYPGEVPAVLSYVVIAARFGDGWIFVRHRRRQGYELPAGHPDTGEESVRAAARELTEETGAIDFVMEPLSYYFVETGEGRQYGRLFLAEVERLGKIADSDEIEGIKVFRHRPRRLSLPEVMTFLFATAREYVRCIRC